MSKIHSRRAILAGIAATPALAAPAFALTGTGPDPIFAALAEHRRLWAEYLKIDVPAAEACQISPAEKAEGDALWALTKIMPTTAAGAGALVAYVRDDLKDGPNNWQLSALANAANALGGMGDMLQPAAPLALGGQPDPIFAVIERHRAAYAVHCAAIEATDAAVGRHVARWRPPSQAV
jgi:hypothetical protein